MGTPFGFPDWQNYRPLDGPLLLDINALPSLQSNQLGPVYVGRWSRIAGDAFISNQQAKWTFTWYADQAGTKVLGQRILITDPNCTEPARFMLPNLGPWLKVAYQCPNPLPTPVLTHHAYGTNRDPGVEFIPSAPAIISQSGVTLPASGQVNFYATGYATGRAHLWVNASVACSNAVLLRPDGTGGFTYIDELGPLAAGTDYRFEPVLPAALTRVQLNNAGAVAGNAYCTLIPDLTGA